DAPRDGQMQSDEPDAYVTLEKFEPRMLEYLVENRFPAEEMDVIISAFKVGGLGGSGGGWKHTKAGLTVSERPTICPGDNDSTPPAQAIDEEGKGYVEAEYLKGLMTQMGSELRSKELESFLNVAQDVTSGRIYYEDYASVYARQVSTNADEWSQAAIPGQNVFAAFETKM
ncbi:Calmodulin, partial [Durusdinium trenchii]